MGRTVEGRVVCDPLFHIQSSRSQPIVTVINDPQLPFIHPSPAWSEISSLSPPISRQQQQIREEVYSE